MATITTTIPDNKAALVRDAICSLYGYQDTIQDPTDPEATIANPMTKNKFVDIQVKNFLSNVVKEYKNRQAIAAVVDEEL